MDESKNNSRRDFLLKSAALGASAVLEDHCETSQVPFRDGHGDEGLIGALSRCGSTPRDER
jgi:hypothetical protein